MFKVIKKFTSELLYEPSTEWSCKIIYEGDDLTVAVTHFMRAKGNESAPVLGLPFTMTEFEIREPEPYFFEVFREIPRWLLNIQDGMNSDL